VTRSEPCRLSASIEHSLGELMGLNNALRISQEVRRGLRSSRDVATVEPDGETQRWWESDAVLPDVPPI